MKNLSYIAHYPTHLQESAAKLIENKTLTLYLKNKYPTKHTVTNDKLLYEYVIGKKNTHFKKFQLDKILYDSKIVVNNALGTHTFISRVQGGKLKSKNELRVASIFKQMPEAFLEMIVTHELAHLKEKEHNKAFYSLCRFVQNNYMQVEFDLRLYLIHLQLFGKIY
ncbi:MAG: YgjP-like metallopeptidase domain-containing protein [Arcobacteraceae bacterium]